MASLDLSGVLGALNTAVSGTAGQSLSGAETQLFSAVAVGAISSALLKSLQHPDVQAALNPLGLTIPGVPTAAAATPATPAKPVITAAQAAVLTAAQLSVLYPNGFQISG